MVVQLIVPVAVAGARMAGSAAVTAARTTAKAAQTTARGATQVAKNARGIQNARLSARTPIRGATRPNAPQILRGNDIIDTNFIQRKSLSARVRQRLFNREKEGPLKRKVLNRLSGREANEKPRSLYDRLMDRMMRTKNEQLRDAKKAALHYMPIYISAIISAFVALFSIIALIFITTGYSNLFFGLFSIDSIVPLSSGGILFYYLAVLVHVLGFIGMGLWMWLMEQKNPFATNIGFATTATCFALGIVIGTQVCFPLLIWVLLVEFTSISSKEESF